MNEILVTGKDAILCEMKALEKVLESLDEQFVKAVEEIDKCQGNVIVIGIGKSGIIARKIASSLSSIGISSVFMHATEALHGDFGSVNRKDVAIVISNSGETSEILTLIPSLRSVGAKIISITKSKESSLAKLSDHAIITAVNYEADPLNVVPTASTIATLAIGDAIVVSLMHIRGTATEEFANYHPSGILNKKVTLKVDDIMFTGKSNPTLPFGSTIKEAVIEISSKGLGGLSIVDEDGRLVGIITDGDVRRGMRDHEGLLDMKVEEIMTRKPMVIRQGGLVIDALGIMEGEGRKISVMPVVNERNEPVGMIRLHDIVTSGVFN